MNVYRRACVAGPLLLVGGQPRYVSQVERGGRLYQGQPFNATLTLRYRFQ